VVPQAGTQVGLLKRDAGPRRGRLRDSLVVLLAVALLVATFLPALDIYLRGDDFEWLHESYGGWQQPGRLFERIGGFFRPIVKASYLLNYTIFGTNARGYAATNLLVHLCNAGLLFAFVRKVRGSSLIAAAVALGWGISSVHSEATLWSAARPDPFLLLATLVLLLYAVGAGRQISIGQQVITAVVWLFAAGSKETWVVIPFVLLAFLLFVDRRPLRDAVRWLASGWLVLANYMGLAVVLPAIMGASPTSYADWSLDIILTNLGWAGLKYLGLGWAYQGSLLGTIGVIVVWSLGGFLVHRSGDRFALWGLLFLAATLALSLPIQFRPSRYNYLPLVGLAITAVLMLERGARALARRGRGGATAAILASFLIAVGYCTYHNWMLRRDTADYQKLGERHRTLVGFADRAYRELAKQRYALVVNDGTIRAIQEAAANLSGHAKLLFPRPAALWELVEPAQLLNFVRPNQEFLWRRVQATGSTKRPPVAIWLFTDKGFVPAGPMEAVSLDDLARGKGLPPRTFLLERVFAKERQGPA
jgi:hypothetical protein